MSKELKALERIKKFYPTWRLSNREAFNLIETALNQKINIEDRLDEIFRDHNIKSFTELNERLCDYNELKFDDDVKQRKLKALQIIKEKRVDIDLLIRCLNSYCIDSARQEYNQWTQSKHLTHEECVLLKEVLL